MTQPRDNVDEREPLRISQDTWDREQDAARLTSLATDMGRRLIVVGRDGAEWEPDAEDPSRW